MGKVYIDKAAIGNILHKLWKKDTGFENIDIVQIAYNRALQDVQCEIDTLEVQEEPVSEDKMTISKEWFEHCKKSWYNEGYIDGEYNRDRQLEEPVSEDLEEAIGEYCSNPDNFATWIGGKDNDDIPLIIKAIKFGAKWQKGQLMAKAIEGNVLANGMGEPILHLWDKGKHLIGKKVKVIVIKEE